jgi:hypothetical protein
MFSRIGGMTHLFAGDDPRTLTGLRARLAELGLSCPANVAVEGLIVDDSVRLLLGRRGPGCRDGIGLLEGMGGRVEGEDLRVELARELAEEIDGAAVEISSFLEAKTDWPLRPGGGTQTWVIVSYVCSLRDGCPVPREPEKCSGFEWFDLADSRPPDLSSSAVQAWSTFYDAYAPNAPRGQYPRGQ